MIITLMIEYSIIVSWSVVLIDLNTETAKHEHIGQLKNYLNYYKKNILESNDNPSVGILLVQSIGGICYCQ